MLERSVFKLKLFDMKKRQSKGLQLTIKKDVSSKCFSTKKAADTGKHRLEPMLC